MIEQFYETIKTIVVANPDAMTYIFLIFLLGMFILTILWVFAGDVIIVWILAWWKRSPIALEWTKNKHYKFHVAKLPKGFNEMIELDGGRRIVEVRRKAVGIGPHKIPIVLFTSEFGAAVSPTEINGKRYFEPMEAFIGASDGETLVKTKDLPLNDGEQVWVRYPSHGLNPDEFVAHQMVNTDPNVMESYAGYKELEARKEAMGGMQQLMQHLPMLVPLLLIFTIAWIILQDHSMAMDAAGQQMVCQERFTQILQSGACDMDRVNQVINASLYKTGAGIK
jgi:hypothetical protein